MAASRRTSRQAQQLGVRVRGRARQVWHEFQVVCSIGVTHAALHIMLQLI